MTCNQLSNKDPTENVIVTFDFSDGLAVGETITGIVSIAVAVSAGVDAAPGAILNGSPTIDVTGTMVLQPVTGGLNQVNYNLKATVNTSMPQRLVCPAILPVRA